jgi:glyoxylase-like metal-dependent hydrolase (beta-lactamase superfamily II)
VPGDTETVTSPLLPRFVEALPAGVRRARLPLPLSVGHVNCYLLVDPPVTIIDPGTIRPESLDQLETLLKSEGLGLSDVEQIVVTHAHPDHFGAAAAIAERSGAPIVCGLPEVASLLGPRNARASSDRLMRLGAPEATARSLVRDGDAMLAGLVTWPRPDMVRGVADGGLLTAGGRHLVCVITPGHAEGHLSLWDPAARVLFSGDHLLPRIMPVPSLGPGDGATGRGALLEYLAGLPRFVALDPAVVLPGHGRAFTDVRVLAAWLRLRSLQRADDIAAILAAGPATPFDVAVRLQWHPAGGRLAMGLAHVQGHLDLLEEAGRVTADPGGTAVSYRLRG